MTTATNYDWSRIVSNSHYEALVAIQEAMRNEDYDEARLGLEELTDAVSRIDRRSVRSHLTRLMMHVLKWKTQPELRSKSWVLTIKHARREIWDTQEDTPSITDETIRQMWDRCFENAKEDAEDETASAVNIFCLTWQEVFEDEYVIARK